MKDSMKPRWVHVTYCVVTKVLPAIQRSRYKERKFFYIRFINQDKIKNAVDIPTFQSNATGKKLVGEIGKGIESTPANIRPDETQSPLPLVPSSCFPKSVSLADLLKARKLVKPKNQIICTGNV